MRKRAFQKKAPLLAVGCSDLFGAFIFNM